VTERVEVLGVPVDAVDMDQALEAVDRFVHASGARPAVVLAVNPEKACMVRGDRRLDAFCRKADLLVPDGVGVVLAVRWLHRRSIGRVPGVDLMARICEAAPAAGYRLVVFGSSDEVNARAVAALRQLHPGIEIVGRENGYVPDGDMPSLVARINASGAHVLFVGLGSPRQERWLEECVPSLSVKVCQGVGGSLDAISGAVPRAPLFCRRIGLEWLYRLTTQPHRAGRQLRLARFAAEVVVARLRGRNGDRPNSAARS
jgi:N-acetylglucosaminyldiphosphoundecaprenol N-acetyl-beta-D-mannosaminyltransferase